ncbi:RNA polymerase sigma factor [Sphingobacterium sp. BIGb0116]|nr:sigma-70 family RNA polymerase sigma factor [Sphingobacterium sp. BIGb0116]MCS4167611.1 RNA polymerase sigma-70 factor (ECF subfamily) [Sphingobacterium sp. BIGb0116]
MDSTIALWLKQIAEGDRTAFDALYNHFWKTIYQYVYPKTKNTEATEDILHDLFLSIWKNRSRLQEINNIESYLKTGARYLTFSYFNKNSEQHRVDIDKVDIIVDDAPIEDRLHYRYLLDLIQEEIQNLPERCRIIFNESRINHKSINQIALEYGLSKSTVENQINKALKRLRLVTKDFHAFLSFFYFFFILA